MPRARPQDALDGAERGVLWADKMRRNAERDSRSTRLAEEHGWQVVRIWECAVRRDSATAALAILG